VPAVVCTGSSSDLDQADCSNWISTVRSSAYFTKANPPACQELSHLGDPCSCTDVITCAGGRIIGVNLNNKGLALTAGNEDSLSHLSGLQSISFFNNSLVGPLPMAWLVKLISLTYWDFSHCKLSGTIPSQIGQLTAVTHFDLFGNRFTGTIPSQLAQLTALTDFSLSAFHNFMGTIPTELGRLTALTAFDIQQNALTGSIPTELAQITGLQRLGLAINHLTGTIPSQLARLTALTSLSLDSNHLTGLVPSLPFKQYTSNCGLKAEFMTNNFTCPLPTNSGDCITGLASHRLPGVTCTP
jgi:Leucine-rich repeat (LRR) protein